MALAATWQDGGNGNRVATASFSLDGKPMVNAWGYHRVEARYDAQGRKVEEAVFGPDGAPAFHADDRAFRVLGRYDPRGNLVETLVLGPNGRPMNVKDGWARRLNVYDSSGKREQRTLWKADPKGVLHLWRRLDAADRLMESAFFTPDDRPGNWPEGHHRWTARYDARGNRIEQANFGLAGEPVATTEGYSRGEARYDANGRMLERALFDAYGNPAFLTSDGSFRTLWKYDSHGRLVETLELGPNGRPMNGKKGWARWQEIFGPSDRREESVFWKADPQGRLHLWKRLDAENRPIETAYFTDDGAPRTVPQGYHRITFRHDSRGNQIETAYFGLNGEPVTTPMGFHLWVSRFDEKGRRREQALFDSAGEPAFQTSDASFRALWDYDSHGNLVQTRVLAPNGRPTNLKQGWASRETVFDSANKRQESVLWKADSLGRLHLWKRLDAADHILEETNFTTDGRPLKWAEGYHRRITRYGPDGKPIELAYFGLDDEPVVISRGYHRWVGRYDEKGRKREQAHFDVAGRPAFRTDDGSFRTLWKYDPHGRLVETLMLGPNGRPMNDQYGWARSVLAYDASGKKKETLLERATPAGKLVAWKRVDGAGRFLDFTYLDSEGRPTLNPEGAYHRIEWRYDEKGRTIECAAFGRDGKPAALEGAHRRTVRYDDAGGSDLRWYGADGKPALCEGGYHRRTIHFDRKRQLRTTSYFGVDDRPTLDADGVHQLVCDLDDESRPVEERCLDLAGEAVQNRRGFARLHFLYRDGAHLDTTAFDLDGKAVVVVPVVTSVRVGSTAERLGFRKGDVLLRYRGETVRSTAGFIAARKANAKRTGPIEVQRGEKRLTIQAGPGMLGVDLHDVAAAVAVKVQ